MGDLRTGPLVRATYPDEVAVWTEWTRPCEVALTAVPASAGLLPDPGLEAVSVSSRTVTVGGRHYALSRLTDLQPATWYSYQVSTSMHEGEPAAPVAEERIQCFRTLDLPEEGNALRLAYGSCRRLSALEPDALSALGPWLIRYIEERETLWPRLLLLIGDQIYADDAARGQARSFEDFARRYVEAWTSDKGVRQVLAAVPTWMIFDDHEVTNNWNIEPTWREQALRQGVEQILVDGLVAYWVYQGWGNVGLRSAGDYELLAIMQEAARSGEDALEALRARIRQAIYGEKAIQWDYTLPTMPPIFVADVRADRSAVLGEASGADVTPRIMSQEQMERVRDWMRKHETSTNLLVSSVPALLPPAIGFAEYAMGMRPLRHVPSSLLRRLGHVLAEQQQNVALRLGFEHWPVFDATWRELVALFAARQRDLVILSGDVHFSYAIIARRTFLASRGDAALYQLVSSPIRNALGPRERNLILGQAWIKRAIYGGLHFRVLPLKRTRGAKRAPAGLMLQNVIALVTLWPQTSDKGKYHVQHIYLGVKEGTLQKVGTTVVDE